MSPADRDAWIEKQNQALREATEKFLASHPGDPSRPEVILLGTEPKLDFAARYELAPAGRTPQPMEVDTVAKTAWESRRRELWAEVVSAQTASDGQRAEASLRLLLVEMEGLADTAPGERATAIKQALSNWDAHVSRFGTVVDGGEPVIYHHALRYSLTASFALRSDEVSVRQVQSHLLASSNPQVRAYAEVKSAERAYFQAAKGKTFDDPAVRDSLAGIVAAYDRNWNQCLASTGSSLLQGSLSVLLSFFSQQAPQAAATLLADLGKSSEPTLAKFAQERLQQENERARLVGTSVDLQFTAADGRTVDFAQLRGKVLLVDFWATWCGPCIAELPNIKKVYAAYHDKGFEIVGISLENAQLKPTDTPEQAAAKLEKAKRVLTDFTAKEQMPWPQYFDGKFWQTEFAVKYGIKGIPAMFLIDKDGKVASTNARGEKLEAEVKRLLGL